VSAVGLEFDHTHNMFTHIAVEMGLPGMLLWTMVWLFTLGEIVRARGTLFGKVLLGFWVFRPWPCSSMPPASPVRRVPNGSSAGCRWAGHVAAMGACRK
jgi:O-antigen ligase